MILRFQQRFLEGQGRLDLNLDPQKGKWILSQCRLLGTNENAPHKGCPLDQMERL